MPQVSSAIDALPPAALAVLRKLGADLATARKRRKQSLRAWALRLDVSVPTLMKLERGDPSVAMGVYATALWLVQRHDALGMLADPRHDVAALEGDVRAATRRGARGTQPAGGDDDDGHG